MPAYNGKIVITFEDGLASLQIDKGAARIPVGIVDRWMRTKGIKMFRAQQMALLKTPTAAPPAGTSSTVKTPPPAPKAPEPKAAKPSAPEGQAPAEAAQEAAKQKAADLMAGAKALHQKQMNGGNSMVADLGQPSPQDEQALAEKLSEDFRKSQEKPDVPSPEMEELEAAMATKGTGETTAGNSAKEEKVNEA